MIFLLKLKDSMLRFYVSKKKLKDLKGRSRSSERVVQRSALKLNIFKFQPTKKSRNFPNIASMLRKMRNMKKNLRLSNALLSMKASSSLTWQARTLKNVHNERETYLNDIYIFINDLSLKKKIGGTCEL